MRRRPSTNDYDRVFVTHFNNPPGSPYRQLMGWRRFAPGSDDVALAFSPWPDATVINKDIYIGVTPALLSMLAEAVIKTVKICGIATKTRILKTAVDLFEAGLRLVVLAEACSSHVGTDCYNAGLLILRRLIGNNQVAA